MELLPSREGLNWAGVSGTRDAAWAGAGRSELAAPGGGRTPEADLKSSTETLVDTHSRSVAKAISWRATGTVDTIIVSYLVTGRIKLALSIGSIELFTKLCLYYFHERTWNRIRYGRAKARQDYEI